MGRPAAILPTKGITSSEAAGIVRHTPPLPARHGLDQPGLDQGLDMLVQGAARAQPEHPAQLIQGRRPSQGRGVIAEEGVDLALSSGQAGHRSLRDTRMCPILC